jgi:solute carrier family 25 protein 39/40
MIVTPFDVIKTRLQTQGSPESMFVPSSHVPPPTMQSSHQSPSSRLKGKGKAIPSSQMAPAMQHARSLAATNLATCCQKTYFTTNLAEKQEILCRFDPREAVESGRSIFSATSRSSPAILETAGSATLALNGAEACLYPSPSIAAHHLPHMSAPSSRHFAGFFDAISKIVQHEGLPALWRGLTPSLVMSVPSQVLYMVGYDTLRTEALTKAPQRYRSSSTGQPTSAYIAATTFVAGSSSRTAVAALLAPLELFRTRLQSTGSHVSLGNVIGSVRDLARTEGISSLWRGLSATLWRDVPFSGAYWAGYEAIRRVLSGGQGMGEINASDNASRTFGIAFASGAGSGMVSNAARHAKTVLTCL